MVWNTKGCYWCVEYRAVIGVWNIGLLLVVFNIGLLLVVWNVGLLLVCGI